MARAPRSARDGEVAVRLLLQVSVYKVELLACHEARERLAVFEENDCGPERPGITNEGRGDFCHSVVKPGGRLIEKQNLASEDTAAPKAKRD